MLLRPANHLQVPPRCLGQPGRHYAIRVGVKEILDLHPQKLRNRFKRVHIRERFSIHNTRYIARIDPEEFSKIPLAFP